MCLTLGEIAEMINGRLRGNSDLQITGADSIRDAETGHITFATDQNTAKQAVSCPAAAVIVHQDFISDGKPCIEVENVHEAFAKVVAYFRPPRKVPINGVSAHAHISPAARIGPDVIIHPGVTVGDDVEIGARSEIHPGVHIMSGCKIGEDVTIFPNSVLYENTVVGSRVIIHATVVLGAYGFGYKTVEGQHKLSAQLGNVVIEDDVELGSGTTIDRGTYGSTRIGQGTKIDDQVMIGHNCRIGRHNILCSQVGIAGSCTTGDYVVMAGQVGVADHLNIGDGAILGPQCGVKDDLPGGESYLGTPARPLRETVAILSVVRHLPELRKQFKALKKQMADLSAQLEARTEREAA